MEQAVWKNVWLGFFLSLAAAGWSRGWEGKTQLTAASLTRLARLASTPLATCDWVCACVCVFSFWNAKHTHTHTHKHTQSVINQFAQINRCGSYLMSGSDVNPPVVVGRSVSEWFHGFFFLRVLAERGSRSGPSSGSPNLQWVSESLNAAPC